MIQILELIKHFVLGIASAILFTTIAMSEITNTKEYAKAYREVQQEYPEGSFQREAPVALGASIAYLETNGFGFENAPTAKAANNFHGMHASSTYIKNNPDKYMTTTGGANIRKYDNLESSIRSVLNLLATDDRYEDVRKAKGKGVEAMLKGMSPYAQDPNYVEKLLSVYKNQIKAVLETQNMLVPKVKSLDQQMNNLK